jgi:hypothetical protein
MNNQIKIWICLYRSQWHRLKPYLPDILHVISPYPPLLVFDCICCNMTVYRKILAAAKKHYPEIVPDIRAERERCLKEASRHTAGSLLLLFCSVTRDFIELFTYLQQSDATENVIELLQLITNA